MNIAFFSYKGGVGRSLVLASTAVAFSSKFNGKIGLVDADIEAPSLHYLLNVEPDPDQNFIDVLLTGTVGSGLIKDRVIPLKTRVSEDKVEKLGEGELFLFPSLPDKPIEKKVPRITFDDTTQEVYYDFLDTFATAEGLDHIFIDCRTGFSVLASMVLNAAHVVILVFRVDRQNLHGVKMMIDRAKRRQRPLLLVANMIPRTQKATIKLAEFQEAIERNIDVVIPFDERLAFGDVVPSLEYKDSDEICQLFDQIVDKIHKGEYQ